MAPRRAPKQMYAGSQPFFGDRRLVSSMSSETVPSLRTPFFSRFREDRCRATRGFPPGFSSRFICMKRYTKVGWNRVLIARRSKRDRTRVAISHAAGGSVSRGGEHHRVIHPEPARAA